MSCSKVEEVVLFEVQLLKKAFSRKMPKAKKVATSGLRSLDRYLAILECRPCSELS